MNLWFSEYRVRALAESIAPQIAPRVEAAIIATIRAELPRLLMDELRRELPEHTPNGSNSQRSMRDKAIRMEFTGTNARALADKYRISYRQVRRILNVM